MPVAGARGTEPPPSLLLFARAGSGGRRCRGAVARLGAPHRLGLGISHRAARSRAAGRRKPARWRAVGARASRWVRHVFALAPGNRRGAEERGAERRARQLPGAGSHLGPAGSSVRLVRGRRGGEARSAPAAGAGRAAVRDSGGARGVARPLRASPRRGATLAPRVRAPRAWRPGGTGDGPRQGRRGAAHVSARSATTPRPPDGGARRGAVRGGGTAGGGAVPAAPPAGGRGAWPPGGACPPHRPGGVSPPKEKGCGGGGWVVVRCALAGGP